MIKFFSVRIDTFPILFRYFNYSFFTPNIYSPWFLVLFFSAEGRLWVG